MKKKSTILNKKSGTIATIAAAVIASIIYDSIKGDQRFNGLYAVLSATKDILSTPIPLWAPMLAVSILTAILIYVFLENRKNTKLLAQYKKRATSSSKPPFFTFTQKMYNGLLWKWQWHLSLLNEWYIDNIHPCCPDDYTPLPPNSYECPRCGKRYRYASASDMEKLHILIMDDAKRMSPANTEYG